MDKQALREAVWDALESSGEARFPFPPHGRIPNFAGADDAAARLGATDAWRTARTLKCNPDAPQLPVRRAALRQDKTVYVAVPRLREAKCFLELDPDAVENVDAATTVSGAAEHGVPVGPEAVPEIDLVVAGSVAVDEAGARVGKGEGYSDLEWGVLAGFDRVGEETTVATTVHEMQVLGSDAFREHVAVADEETADGATTADDGVPADAVIAPAAHDVPLDLICTPDRTVETDTPADRPAGIDWDALPEERLDEIPVLDRLRP